MLLYRFADLEIFNNPNEGHNIIFDAEIKEYKSVGANDVFVRIVEDQSNLTMASSNSKQIFKEISDRFTIIINDPNDTYNKLPINQLLCMTRTVI